MPQVRNSRRNSTVTGCIWNVIAFTFGYISDRSICLSRHKNFYFQT